MSDIDKVLARIDQDLDAALDRLFAVLRIKSISTDPAYAKECQANAEWHAADLRSIGFEASSRPTPGHPIVVAHDRSASGPSALFYGHYDVQPVDPLDLWDTPPFDPRIEEFADGRKIIVGTYGPNDCITSAAALRVEIAGSSAEKLLRFAVAPARGLPSQASRQSAASSGFAAAQASNRACHSACAAAPRARTGSRQCS